MIWLTDLFITEEQPITGLHRTPLTTPRKSECVAKALAGQEASGGIAALSREFGISRPSIYTASGVASEEEARHQLPKIPAGDPKRRTRQRHRIGRARSRCQEAIERYDRFEVAMGKVQEVIECVDLKERA